MKTKLSKVLGVSLALVLVFALCSVFAPVKGTLADEGNQQWLAQNLPTGGAPGFFKLAAGTDVTEYAYATGAFDGVMYAIDGAANLNAANAILKSPAAGLFWTGIPAIGGAAAIPITNIAVSPNSSNVIAVTGGSNTAPVRDQAWISTDGGATWAQLPNTNVAATAANQRIMDIKIGPDRPGTIYGRDYAVALSDNAVGVAEGSLQILGETATWTNIVAPGTEDFTSCEFSPNFVGDRIVTAVGSENATPVTNFRTYNCTNYSTAAPVLQHAIVALAAISDYDPAAGGANVLISDIALPTGYDVTMPGMERAYVSIAEITGALQNVWRCDGILAAAGLMTAGTAAAQNRSIAYAGDVYSGRLFVGNWAAAAAPPINTGVWYTDDAQTNLPVWYPSFKPPTGNGGRAYVRCSPGYSSNTTVYCGTTGANESAFSASEDGGVTYNQLSLIDSGAGIATVVAIDDIALTSDGSTLFVATDDGVAELSLWETVTPCDLTTWVRIYCFTENALADTGRVVLNPDWGAAPEIYFAETPTVNSRFFASVDGGSIFSAYTAPLVGQAIADLVVEKSKTLYLGIGANVYASANGGQVWTQPSPASVAAVISLAAPGDGVVLVGGIGGCSYSPDGGGVFIPMTMTGLPAANLYILADEDYASNGRVYAGNMAAAGAIYRIDSVGGSLWENLGNSTAAAIVGMSMSNGAMYAMSAASADRTLTPNFAVGEILWGVMNVPAAAVPAASTVFSEAGNSLYAAEGAVPALWAYADYFATLNPNISSPADGTSISIDPVTGRADIVTVNLTSTGTGTGLANDYQFAIYETAAGVPGGTFLTTGGNVAATYTPLTIPTAPVIRIFPGAALTDLNFTFVGGKEYGIMARAWNAISGDTTIPVAPPTDVVYSQWSAPITISIEPSTGIISPTTAGPVLQSPQPGDQNVNPDCSFSWAPMASVTAYSFILAKDAALTDVVASDTVSGTAFGPITLDYDTDYYYAVQASAPTSSVQSIAAFHTMVQGVEKYTCQYCGLTFDTRAELEAHIAAVHAPTTPLYIWIVIAIGAILVIVVVWLIFSTRRA